MSPTPQDVVRSAGLQPGSVGCSTDEELVALADTEISNAQITCVSLVGREIPTDNRYRPILDAVVLRLAAASLRQVSAMRARSTISIGESGGGSQSGLFSYPESVLESVRKDLAAIPGNAPTFFTSRKPDASDQE